MSAKHLPFYVQTALLLSFLLGGCAHSATDGPISTHRVTFTDPTRQTDQLWSAILDTLRLHHFELDRVDRRAGVVTTMPEASQHFFEFWRHDVNTKHDFFEATLNPLRRWVEVSLLENENHPEAHLAVAVHKERLSSPDRQFNSTGAAYQFFSNRLPSTTGLVRVSPQDDRWLPMGRDPAMEAYLLRKILRRAGEVFSDEPSANDASSPETGD